MKLCASTRIAIIISVCAIVLAMGCSPSTFTTRSMPVVDVRFIIPYGTAAALDRGEAAFQFPEEIMVQAGASVVIANQDHAMHYFFDIPVAPGQSIRKAFPRAGDFVYQGGLSCSISRSNTIKVRVV